MQKGPVCGLCSDPLGKAPPPRFKTIKNAFSNRVVLEYSLLTHRLGPMQLRTLACERSRNNAAAASDTKWSRKPSFQAKYVQTLLTAQRFCVDSDGGITFGAPTCPRETSLPLLALGLMQQLFGAEILAVASSRTPRFSFI